MAIYQLLSAVGPDQPGIVSRLSEILFQHGCNLEDSAMMRLGSEFGVQLIFTSEKKVTEPVFLGIKKDFNLSLQVKTISKKLASSRHNPHASARVVLHGYDRPGIVYKVTRVLSRDKFNITDLATRRTRQKGKPGYLLYIEGDLKNARSLITLRRKLAMLAKRLRVTIRLDPVSIASL